MTYYDMAKQTGLTVPTIRKRLATGWTANEILWSAKHLPGHTLKQVRHKMNHTTIRCKTCGMEFNTTHQSAARYCSTPCKTTFWKMPEEFGLWWQT